MCDWLCKQDHIQASAASHHGVNAACQLQGGKVEFENVIADIVQMLWTKHHPFTKCLEENNLTGPTKWLALLSVVCFFPNSDVLKPFKHLLSPPNWVYFCCLHAFPRNSCYQKMSKNKEKHKKPILNWTNLTNSEVWLIGWIFFS